MRRTRKWDVLVLLAFFLVSCIIGIAIAVKVVGERSGKSQEWIRITDAPTDSPDEWDNMVPMTTLVDDSNDSEDTSSLEYQIDTTQMTLVDKDGNQQLVPQTKVEDYVIPLPDYSRLAIELDANSPQAVAYRWLTNDPYWESYPEWRQLQRFALVTFYYATNGHSWTLSDNWLRYDNSECDWFTNTGWDFKIERCDSEDRYISLMLGHNDLRGALPLELGFLTGLNYMDVRSNQLHGLIPRTLGELTGLLSVDMGSNTLTGEIPSLSALKGLVKLDLSTNALTGRIQTEFGLLNNLQDLTLSTNELYGPLPTEVAALTALTTLNVEENMLNATIPAQLSFLTDLNVLRLGSNQVSLPITG